MVNSFFLVKLIINFILKSRESAHTFSLKLIFNFILKNRESKILIYLFFILYFSLKNEQNQCLIQCLSCKNVRYKNLGIRINNFVLNLI